MKDLKSIIAFLSILTIFSVILISCKGKSDDEKLKEFNGRIEALANKIEKLEGTIESNIKNTKVDEEKLKELNERIEALANKIEKFEGTIESNIKNTKVEIEKPDTGMVKWYACKAQIATLVAAMDSFLLNTTKYPASLDDFVKDPGLLGWAGPYLKEKQLLDPWGRLFIYDQNKHEIISYGADGVTDGDGYNQDINNVFNGDNHLLLR